MQSATHTAKNFWNFKENWKRVPHILPRTFGTSKKIGRVIYRFENSRELQETNHEAPKTPEEIALAINCNCNIAYTTKIKNSLSLCSLVSIHEHFSNLVEEVSNESRIWYHGVFSKLNISVEKVTIPDFSVLFGYNDLHWLALCRTGSLFSPICNTGSPLN